MFFWALRHSAYHTQDDCPLLKLSIKEQDKRHKGKTFETDTIPYRRVACGLCEGKDVPVS